MTQRRGPTPPFQPTKPGHAASSSTQGRLAEAVRHHQAGRLQEAERLYDEILKSSPRHPDTLHLLGLVAYQKGNHERAESLIGKALEINPDNPAYSNNLGNVFAAQHRPQEASELFSRATAQKPDFTEAHNNLGNALQKLDRWEDAVAAYQRALASRPRYAEAHSNLGAALRRLGRFEEAQASYERALEYKPDYPAAWNNLGLVLHERARYEEALPYYDKALALDPDYAEAHANRAILLLLLGRFGAGWKEYEWRWKVDGFTTSPRDLGRPLWDGSELRGETILLHAEQGLGSAIQFVRYVSRVAQLGGQVMLECPMPLLGLFSSLTEGVPAPVKRLIVRGETLPEFDLQAPLMSLPRILGTTLDTIPNQVPYLTADPAVADAWRERMGATGRPKIGVVWAGNPRHVNDRNRSMPSSFLSPLLHETDASIFSLQIGAATQDDAILASDRIQDLGKEIRDFADTAAIIANLDLVISVDTAVAHLAGAMGRPTWMLVPFVPEWRWLLDREDTPWYPTMRLFRQTAPGDWRELMDRVTEAVAAFES